MNDNHPLPPEASIRLYVTPELAAGNVLSLDDDRTHYLRHVRRCSRGDEILLFNGRDGEWLARITKSGKKTMQVEPYRQTREQTGLPDIWLLFAPVKRMRLDFVAQKATEMGAGRLWPVMTGYTQGGAVNIKRLQANAIAAAEQCGLLAIPDISPPVALENLLAQWPDDTGKRHLLVCDEQARTGQGLAGLSDFAGQPAALLIGPEGGFTIEERTALQAHKQAHIISLGPRILRTDTAAIAALAAWQYACGDWHDGPGRP